MFRILFTFMCLLVFVFGGAAFESENYLIWIGSKCPAGSTTCTDVTYNQTNKKNGKTLVIQGGEPIVGNLSGNLIGYKFFDLRTNRSFELSMDLNGKYTLFLRVLNGTSNTGNAFKQESVQPLKEEIYLQKLQKIKK